MHALIEISRFLGQAFIAGLWQGLVLVSAVALLLRLAPGLSAAARYAIWWFAFGFGTMIPLVHLPASVALHIQTAPALHVGTEWGIAIAVIWVVFAMVRAVQLVLQVIHLHRISKRATPVATGAAITALLHDASVSAQLCTSDDVESPSVIGFFSPRLLIPKWLLPKLTQSELQQIVLHESEHLRRHDDWVNLLQKISLVLFPLNPALLWMDRRLSLERELACDAGVIASTKSRFDYARCLTQLAEHRMLHGGIALTLSAWSRRSELARRVHHLLNPGRHISHLRMRLSTALICFGLIIGALGMASSPHVLSFTDEAEANAQAADRVTLPEITRPVPVVYRPTIKAHPVLLKASDRPRKSPRIRHKVTQSANLLRVHATTTKRSQHESQPEMILTTFNIQATRSNRAGTVSLRPHNAPAYAAVPFEDGWLVIQL